MRESDWAIVRGEVSFILGLQTGTPLLWDMYKKIGSWHDGQARDFLDWIVADDTFRNLFLRLNGQEK
jgi:hypothetical protein